MWPLLPRIISEIPRISKKLIEYTLAITLFIMTLLVFLNVVLRYGFNSGIIVSQEIARYLFVWLTYVGSVVVMAEGKHQRTDVLLNLFPVNVALLARFFGGCLVIFASSLFGYGSFAMAIANMNNLSPVTGIPVGYLYWAGFLSSIGMILAILCRAWGRLAGEVT